MKFKKASLDGVWLIEPEIIPDLRGAFARVYCVKELTVRELDAEVAQSSISFNLRAGTLRGLHYQGIPFAEVKVVRVQRGAIWDVAVDLRKDSPTYSHWFGTELTAVNCRAMYVPKGFAHGFVTLEDNTEVLYQMSVAYVPRLARGVRWDDPDIGIEWPRTVTVISDKDRSLPLLADAVL